MSLKWMNLLILGSCLVSKNTAIKCYTCGENDENNISCSQFQVEDSRFSRECEAGSKSCRLSRKVNENIILSRSCEKLKLNDCKTANSVEFCFCTADLCNKINPLDDEGEDEFDLSEGSGIKKVDFDVSTETESSIHDTTVKTKVNLHESIEKNMLSSSCSRSQCIWCLLIILVYLYI